MMKYQWLYCRSGQDRDDIKSGGDCDRSGFDDLKSRGEDVKWRQ